MNSVLIIGENQSKKLTLLKHLTNDGITVDIPKDKSSHSGIIQPFHLKTKYYELDIHFWIDEFKQFEEWLKEFNEVSEEFKDVLQILIINFKFKDGLERFNKIIENVKKIEMFDDLEIVLVGVDDIDQEFEEIFESFEDKCFENGIELIYLNEKRIENEYKEKLGKERLIEILQCHEWTIQKSNEEYNDESNDDNELNNDEKTINDKQLNNIEDILSNDKLEFGEFLEKIEKIKKHGLTISDEKEKHEMILNAIEELMGDITL